VAPLGTSLTQTQARLLATLHPSPIVATDADTPGRTAAERAYWLITQHSVSPRTTTLPEGSDPADLLHVWGPDALAVALGGGHALAQQLIDNLLAGPLSDRTFEDVAALIAADTPDMRIARGHDLTNRTDALPAEILTTLAVASIAWNRDPAFAAQEKVQLVTRDHALRVNGPPSRPDGDVPSKAWNREVLRHPMSVHEDAPDSSHSVHRRFAHRTWVGASKPSRGPIER
jgi:DNA primase